MPAAITDQVVDFYYKLFNRIFSEPFRSRITERLKRDAVIRQIEDAAGAASQSLTRFFLNEQLNERQVASVLRGFSKLKARLTLADTASSNDGRWKEVIALYCGLAPAPAARSMIQNLINQPDTLSLSTVLADAYLSAGPEVLQDDQFRHQVLERIALAPGNFYNPHSVKEKSTIPKQKLPVWGYLTG